MSCVSCQHLSWNLIPNQVLAVKESRGWLWPTPIEVKLHPEAPFLQVLEELNLQQALEMHHDSLGHRYVVFYRPEPKEARYFLVDPEAVQRLVKTAQDEKILREFRELPDAISMFSQVLRRSIHKSLDAVENPKLERIRFDVAKLAADLIFSEITYPLKNIVTLMNGSKGGLLAVFRKNINSCDARELLGRGSFKRVFDAVWIQQDKGLIQSSDVAIAKPIDKTSLSIKNLELEQSIDALLPDSPYLLRVIDSVTYPDPKDPRQNKLILIYPRAEGDLSMLMGNMTAAQIQKAIRCTLEGVVSLHAAGLRHGDLKPSNFLARGDLAHFWVADFGFLSKFNQPFLLGSYLYLAPEALRKLHQSDDCGYVDAWALGASFCKLLTFQLPFTENSLRRVSQNLIDDASFQKEIDEFLDLQKETIENQFPGFWKILKGLLQVDINDRFTTFHAMNELNCL
jgi:hypothetical protein